MVRNKIIAMLAIGFFTVCWGMRAEAQSMHMTARSTALGGGGSAYVDGYHANFINPANIMLGEGEKPRRMVGLLGGVGSSMGGSLVNVHVYNEYFTGGATMSGAYADEALTSWFGADPNEMKSLGMQAAVIPVGLSYRSRKWGMSAALRSRMLANSAANKGFAQLGLLGLNSRIFGAGQPVNVSGEAVTFHEASVGFALTLLEMDQLFGFAENVRLHGGVAPKKILGANTVKFDFNSLLAMEGEGPYSIDAVRHTFSYQLETTGALTRQLEAFYQDRRSRQGTPDIADYLQPQGKDFYGMKSAGWGLDVGATLEMDLHLPFVGAFFKGPEHVQLAVSLTDIGEYTVSNSAGRFSAEDELLWRGFDYNRQRIDGEFGGNSGEYFTHILKDSIASDIYGSFAPLEKRISVRRSLPGLFNIGGQVTLSRLSVAIDFMQGLNNVGTNSRRPALAAGVEYDLLGFLPLRAGMRTGGYSSTSYSAGVGFEFRNFEFSIGAHTVNNSAQYGSSIGAAWSGLVFRF